MFGENLKIRTPPSYLLNLSTFWFFFKAPLSLWFWMTTFPPTDCLAKVIRSGELNPHQTDVSESLIRRGGANMPHKGNGLYWLYFCILCNKNGIKWLRGDKCWPSLGPGPALVLQWTLQGPWNRWSRTLIKIQIRVNKNQENAFFGHFWIDTKKSYFIHFFKTGQNIMSLLKQNIQITPPLWTD